MFVLCMYVRLSIYIYMYIYHISVMELGHLLTRSGLTYPEVSSKVYHNSFCPLGSSVSLLLVIYFEAFYLRIIYIYIYIYICVCVCVALVIPLSQNFARLPYCYVRL